MHHARRLVWSLSLLLLPPLAAGCGGGKRIEVPRIDPKGLATKALAEYDLDKDGSLDARELARCPGLKAALARADRDKDGRLSRAELEEYFQSWADSKTGLQQVLCRVTLDGNPLSGAEVQLEPEAFLGGIARPAKGVSDERGEVRFQVEGGGGTAAAQSGCNLGIYRVRITRTAEGKEVVPARYNTNTQLGIEVSPSMLGRTVFHLESR
jgi:hypothetical protein